MKHYTSSFIVTAIALALGFLIGWWPTHSVAVGLSSTFIVAVLCVLEISLSFDNAVVNATVLRNWDETWRKRFIRYGIPIAVFGMRLVFPLAIVAIIVGIGPFAVVDMALNRPDEYAVTLTSVHHQIAAFGGAFLFMVFLKFFLDHEKDSHWIGWLETPLAKVGKLDMVQVAVAVVTILVFSSFLGDKQLDFVVAGMWGVVTYVLADAVGSLAGGEEAENGEKIIRAGVGGFLYLELLDASFSFDGVIGAFALSHNIFIIALGLGVGAMFVRSMTLHLVETGTLSSYRYLEHGAFWAIGALAVIMFIGAIDHHLIPEWFTGLIGAALIGLSLWSSIKANRRDDKANELAKVVAAELDRQFMDKITNDIVRAQVADLNAPTTGK